MAESCMPRIHRPIDIVLDIDDTLVYVDFNGTADLEVLNPKMTANIPYRLAPGAIEFLGALFRIPNARISFFSAGDKWRNKDLVPKLVTMVRKKYEMSRNYFMSLIEPDRFRCHCILSADNVSATGRKDITLVASDVDLGYAILVDDNHSSAFGQEPNLIKIRGGLGSNAPDLTLLDVFELETNLIRALGYILRSIVVAHEKKVTVVRALTEIKHENDADTICYEYGLHELQKIHPDFSVVGSLTAT